MAETIHPAEILARAEKRLRPMVERGTDHAVVMASFRTFERMYREATAPVVDDEMALAEAVQAA